MAPETLVFLDETSTNTSFTRMYGRAPRGDRVLGQVPRNHGPNVSCLMAISPTVVLAPLAIEGAIDGAVFVRWLREWLLPTLPVGTTIICDNLSVHRHQAVEAAGCHLRYLPPYSPNFNPIEQVFSTLKARLRAAASRTFDSLVTAIGAALDVTTADHLANCYRHCGYDLPTPRQDIREGGGEDRWPATESLDSWKTRLGSTTM